MSIPRVTFGRVPSYSITGPVSLHQEYRLRRVRDLLESGKAVTNSNVAYAFSIKGPLNRLALASALQSLIERHEQLRSGFFWAGDRFFTAIEDRIDKDVMISVDMNVGISSLPADSEISSLLVAASNVALDFTRPPLLRAWLIDVEPGHHLLLLVLDHLVSDGWSMGIIFSELRELYAYHARGVPLTLPSLAAKYTEFANWQRQWAEGREFTQQLEYWRSQLSGVDLLPDLSLPFTQPGHDAAERMGASVKLKIPEDVQHRLRWLCSKYRITPFTVVLAVINVVIYLYTGKSDLPIVTPIAGRTDERFHRVVGWFANVAIARVQFGEDQSFEALLSATSTVAIEMYENQDIPRFELLKRLGPAGFMNPDRRPWVFFALEDEAEQCLQLDDLQIQQIDPGAAVPGQGISIYGVTRATRGLQGLAMSYSAGDLTTQDANRVLADMLSILQTAAENPRATVSEIVKSVSASCGD